MTTPDAQEQEEQMMDVVYHDQALRDRVRAEIRKRPDTAVDQVMLLIAGAWARGRQQGLVEEPRKTGAGPAGAEFAALPREARRAAVLKRFASGWSSPGEEASP